MKTNYSQKLAQCIHSFLKSTKAEYTFNANDGTFWFPFQWPNSPFGSLPVQIQVKEEFIQHCSDLRNGLCLCDDGFPVQRPVPSVHGR